MTRQWVGGFLMGRPPVAALLLAALPVFGQYPGQVSDSSKGVPALRAVAVLEWTGPEGKPKTSRLVPVTVFDGEALQDGGIYLARPEPLAVYGGVEYILEKDGRHIGLFDLQRAGQEEGSWVGFGSWRPIPKPKPQFSAQQAQIDIDDEYSDRPVLHRKHHPGDAPAKGSGQSSGSASNAPPVDPDRPTLHKPSEQTASSGSSSSSAPAPDPDRPRLTEPAPQKPAAPATTTAYVQSLPTISDPDRPRLLRGKYTGDGPPIAPSLMGLPSDMHQMVAVSDPRNRPQHPWVFSWANPADAAKMKADMEDLARAALGLTPPAPATPPAASRKAASSRKTPSKDANPVADAEAAPLRDEQYRVFELAYGAGATLVLTAHTDGPLVQQKFVTLIAQPDLYGNVIVLMKSVTDGAHLDDKPRMRLVDAVDAMGDNRGELLFELRGLSQRQFALYRVLRGSAEQIFITSGGDFGIAATH